jgi:hypothetical protein
MCSRRGVPPVPWGRQPAAQTTETLNAGAISGGLSCARWIASAPSPQPSTTFLARRKFACWIPLMQRLRTGSEPMSGSQLHMLPCLALPWPGCTLSCSHELLSSAVFREALLLPLHYSAVPKRLRCAIWLWGDLLQHTYQSWRTILCPRGTEHVPLERSEEICAVWSARWASHPHKSSFSSMPRGWHWHIHK